METDIKRNPYSEWLDYVKPVGLVIAPSVMKDLELAPAKLTATDSSLVEELLNPDDTKCAISNVWKFMEQVLDWQEEFVAGTPNGPPLGNKVKIPIPELGITLSPDWAVRLEENNDVSWQLLVKLHSDIDDLDARGKISSWEETPQRQFERLLRDSEVHAGLLVAKNEMRLVYAPSGETSGYISFPIRPLASVAGRPVLAGLKLVLESFRLIGDEKSRRLRAILDASRNSQTEVSTELANQVLGALHELLRGFYSADSERIVQLARDNPEHLYDGLLTILMRLVFILYAEDRNLLPSRDDERAKEIYNSSYSLRGLFTRLREDESFNPDTMDERKGAWGQMLALFRMIHSGYSNDANSDLPFVKSRGGKLFNPDEFPFIEGRLNISDNPRILHITDGCVLRILTDLMTLRRKRQTRELLSYRTLDVEQIGSVYETVMGFTVELANDKMIAIKAGKKDNTPVFIGLNNILDSNISRIKYIKDESERSLDGNPVLCENVEKAKNIEELKHALDPIVDERGSPYHSIIDRGIPILQPTDERRKTGSHYTPRALTEPIVKNTLEPIFERLGVRPKPSEILDLKVCDPAMGSGAFLVEVCRAMGKKLVQSWQDWPEEKQIPQVEDDEEIIARRLIATNCIYGVDRNSRAVDLAKLSLWLATLAKTEEFTFLDHALKCGDSLVGLSLEQLGNATWETGDSSRLLFSSQINDKVNKVLKIREKIRFAIQSTPVSELESQNLLIDNELSQIRDLGDALISTFFNFENESKRKEARTKVEFWFLKKDSYMQEIKNYAKNFREGKKGFSPFHWEIEFPEVFMRESPGFDVIVGNPPFAGKNTISKGNRDNYLEWLLHTHENTHGKSDLVAHFFLKSFELINERGISGLIATSTISEGVTRSSGLTNILKNGGQIYRAQGHIDWPGEANTKISVIHFKKGEKLQPILNNKEVNRISAYLDDGILDSTPNPILTYKKSAFQGVTTLGKGFEFDDKEAAKGECNDLAMMRKLIEKNPRNRSIIFPYIGGDEVNSSPTHKSHRFVINFGSRPLRREDNGDSWYTLTKKHQKKALTDGIVPINYPDEVAADWPDLLEIVENLVKRVVRDKQEREPLKKRWWQYAEKRPGLTNAIENLEYVCVSSRRTKHWAVARLKNESIFADSLVVFAFQSFSPFAILQSRVHEVWAKYFSTKRGLTFTYTPSNCFETFPFPNDFENSEKLNSVGEEYLEFRTHLMKERKLGLTEIYNRFHDRSVNDSGITELRKLHTEMDHAVLEAYGWTSQLESAFPVFSYIVSEDGKHSSDWCDWNPEFKEKILELLLQRNIELSKNSNKTNKTKNLMTSVKTEMQINIPIDGEKPLLVLEAEK